MAHLSDVEATAQQEPKAGNFFTRTLTRRTNADHPEKIQVPLGIEALEPTFSMPEYLASRSLTALDNAEVLSQGMDKYTAPFKWPIRKKTITLVGTFIAAAISAAAAGSFAMAGDQLIPEWGVTVTEFNIGITVFVAAFGFSPMIFARISETYGRYWVFVGAGIVFLLGTLGCAVTTSYAGMLVARFIAGSGCSIFVTLTGGVVSDLFSGEDRNTPMALYSTAVLVGTGLGPMFGGIIVDRMRWTWIFWPQLMAIGLVTLGIFFFFTETRGNILLKNKCHALNKICSRARPADYPTTNASPTSISSLYFVAEVDQAPAPSIGIIWASFSFPCKLLATEPVVFWFSAWASFAWAILYMQFNSISIVFKSVYGFNNTQVGAVYVAVVMGAVLAAILNLIQDPLLRKLWPGPMSSPEGWLYSACISSILLPVGLFWFGWSATASVHWISPVLAIGACTMGIYNIYLAVFNYLAATYHRYSSSAQAAQSMCRNLTAGAFPLFTHIMFRNLGLGVAGSILGALGLVLTLVPWLLSFFGEKIRARSAFASELKAEGM